MYKRQLCLQHQTGRDFTASDGGHQLFQLRNLPDVSTLINQTAVSYTHLDVYKRQVGHFLGLEVYRMPQIFLAFKDMDNRVGRPLVGIIGVVTEMCIRDRPLGGY